MSVYKPPQGFPFWTILAVAILGCLVAFGLWHFNIEPICTWLNPLFTWTSALGAGLISSFNIGGALGSIQKMISDNPIGFAVTAVTGISAVWGIIGKIRADNAKKATEQAAIQQINDLDNKYTNKLAILEQQVGKEDALQLRLNELESTDWVSQLKTKDDQINKLTSQQELLSKMLQEKEEEIILGTKVIERVVVK